MKTIEVTIVRRVETVYEYEVGDDFDIDAPGAFRAVEDDYFGGEFGSEDEIFEEVLNWDVEHIRLSEASK